MYGVWFQVLCSNFLTPLPLATRLCVFDYVNIHQLHIHMANMHRVLHHFSPLQRCIKIIMIVFFEIVKKRYSCATKAELWRRGKILWTSGYYLTTQN